MQLNIHFKKALLWVLSGIVMLTLFSFCSTSKKLHSTDLQKILVFYKTNGYKHESIPNGIEAIKKLGEANQFSVDVTADSLFFTDQNLNAYGAIIFFNTTGEVLGLNEQAALQKFIRAGGGFVGVHAATDCGYTWPWYVQLVGASFESHPAQQIAKLVVVDTAHISTKHLPKEWERKDEWYNFKNINAATSVLLTIDETSYKGGKNGSKHPMAWFHSFEGGRAFYTALGHTKESYSDPLFLQHLLGGINYALGVDEKTTIWIVRHAEKDTSAAQKANPALTTIGQQRAQDLAAYLKGKEPSVIYSTDTKRTRQTAGYFTAPVTIYNPRQLTLVASELLKNEKGKRVLLVGHSNTVLETLEALGGKRPIKELTDDDYDYIFKIVIDAKGNITTTMDHYGALHHGGKGTMQ